MDSKDVIDTKGSIDTLTPSETKNLAKELHSIVINNKTKSKTSKHPESKRILATAMRQSGFTYSQIAQATDLPVSTVSTWVNTRPIDDPSLDLSVNIREQANAKSILLANSIWDSIDQECLERASLQQKAISAKVIRETGILDIDSNKGGAERSIIRVVDVRAKRQESDDDKENVTKEIESLKA